MNDDECVSAVKSLLDQRRSNSNRTGIPGEQVLVRLAELPVKCRPALRVAARTALTASDQVAEGDFNVLLGALTRIGDPTAADLSVRAILHPQIMIKEDYVSFLEYLDQPEEALAALLTVLDRGRTMPDRGDLVVTIRTLHSRRATAAVSVVTHYVRHPDPAVRRVAIGLLRDLDEGYLSTAAFREQLQHENDPTSIELLIDGLTEWDVPLDPTLLDRFAADAGLPGSLRQSARRARRHSE